MSAATLSNTSAAKAAPFTIDRALAARLTGGRWLGRQEAVTVRGACIDSRQVQPGSLFACLSGGSRDGHDFAATAVGDGAALVLASRAIAVPVPVLLVADVGQALGQLATEFRRLARGTTWIGVTGSNGKTTVKELIASACAEAGPVHATHGNLNNHLGVPLTILATPADTTVAVIEMGANHAGEIGALAAMASPSIGVITSIGPAHLEGFGSLMGVARAKSELFSALPPDGLAVLGLHGLEHACATVGEQPERIIAEVHRIASGRRLVLVGGAGEPLPGRLAEAGIEIETPAGVALVPLLGEHNLANAAIAFQAACAAGVAPAAALRGLAQAAPVPGRLCPRRCGGHLILDDSYNANPASMVAGLRLLSRYPGRRLAVLGHMAELGAQSEAGHRLVGAEAARLQLSLVAVDAQTQALFESYRSHGGDDGVHARSRDEALALITHRLAVGATTVLVKGSRSAGLEWIVEHLVSGGRVAP